MGHFVSRLFLAILVVALLSTFAPQAAHAHARLLRSDPTDGAALLEAPRQASLWFDEPVAAAFSSIEVLDAQGRPVAAVALSQDPADPRRLLADLPDLPDGLYLLAWEVLSDADNHVTRGTLVFSLGQGAEGIARPPVQVEGPPPPIQEVALRILNLVGLMALIGSLTTLSLILRAEARPIPEPEATRAAARRVWGLGVCAAALILIVGGGLLLWQLSVLRRALSADLFASRFGLLWLARQGLALLALVALGVSDHGRRWGQPLAWLATLALIVLHAFGGHAAGLAGQTALAVGVQALHLLAAGTWIGSLVALLVGLLPLLWSRQANWRAVALSGWRRFWPVAALGVGLLAATGLYSAGRQVASMDAWLVTLYGQLVGGKTLLFLTAGLIGLINSARLHPGLAGLAPSWLRRRLIGAPGEPPRLAATLLIEAGLAGILIALSGTLTAVAPARGPEFDPPRPDVKPPSTLTLPADDLLVTLSVRPNKAGANLITVLVRNTRRPPPAEINRVLVRLTYLEQDLGTRTLTAALEDADTYRLEDNAFSLSGAWRAQVVVRRLGREDSLADFAWQVESPLPPPPPRPVLVSNAPLEPALTWAAGTLAVLIALGALAVAVGARRRIAQIERSPTG